MKFLLSVKANHSYTQLDTHFGRAAWFVVAETTNDETAFIENDGGKQSSGAGAAAAQCAVDQKVEAVVSGHFGPHAAQVIAAAGIKMFLLNGTCQSIGDVKRAMSDGSLKEQAT